MYTHIIWDWNGTLLDDVEWSIECINALLNKRSLPVFSDTLSYQKVFGFPVIDYYQAIGFDFSIEPFTTIGAEFIERYYGDPSQYKLHHHVVEVTKELDALGIEQIILSASKQSFLIEQLNKVYPNHPFSKVIGIDNIYATSKIEQGKSLLRTITPDHVLLIGDTLHDIEVAKELQIDCLIIANGHQNKERFNVANVKVIHDIQDVLTYISKKD